MKFFLFFYINVFLSPALAQELVIRADISQPLNLPVWSKMPSTSPACNNEGVTTKYVSFFDEEVLHPAVVQKNSKGLSASEYFDHDLSISEVHFTSSQESVFALNFLGGTKGVLSLSSQGKVRQLVRSQDFPMTENMSRPSIVNGEVLFRSLNKDGLHTIFLGSKILMDEQNGVAYLYLPTAKSNQIVLKVGYGAPGEVSPQNPDKIISIQNSKHTVVAVDRDFDPTSEFIGFDNSPVPDGNGGVAFVADHVEKGRSLWLYKNGRMTNIFSEKESEGELEYFSPDVNSKGDVVFRTIQKKRRSIVHWSGDKKVLTEMMTQGQSVQANEANLRVMDRERWPAFAGKPCINERGEVYIHAVLENSLNNENKGSGIFRL